MCAGRLGRPLPNRQIDACTSRRAGQDVVIREYTSSSTPHRMLRLPLPFALRTVILAVVLSACGCGGGDTGSVTPIPTAPTLVLTTITVSLSSASLQVGQAATVTAAGFDQNGSPIAVGTVTWTSSNTSVATVTSAGAVAALAAGQSTITASTGGKSGQATLSVTAAPAPVATVVVTPASASIAVGGTQQLTPNEFDAGGTALGGRIVTWATGDPTKATVSTTGLVTGVAAGTVVITATSEGKSGSSTITVSAPVLAQCTSTSALQLALGEVRTLTAAQAASLCVGGLAASSEYVLIPFNNSNVATLTTNVSLTGTNTGAVTATPNLAPSFAVASALTDLWEPAFRAREQRDIGPPRSRALVTARGRGLGASTQLTGVPTLPTVGTVVQLNSNLTGNTCSAAKILHPARVVAVLTHTIVFADTLAPAGGYTDAELLGFGTAFDTLGFALDTLNFGTPSDIDGNGRVGIFFTPGVNPVPAPPGGIVGGLFAERDLLPATAAGCIASNEGEMFYLPVPDPNKTINSNYASKSTLANRAIATLVHEFQHLINAGRRRYVNNSPVSEETWLNEGLSHIAEELLYYKVAGKSPGQNLDLAAVTADSAQADAINTYQFDNLSRLISYDAAPAKNSPFSQVDGLEMRGAIWQLLRYSADRKGGSGRSIWYPLVNSTTAGQANFNSVFGDIITNTRDWAVAQFTDDDGLGVAAKYTNPSWNFRSVLPKIVTPNAFPLATSTFVAGSPLSLSIVGGGAAYVRFSVAAGIAAAVVSTSSGASLPANIDFILVRTK